MKRNKFRLYWYLDENKWEEVINNKWKGDLVYTDYKWFVEWTWIPMSFKEYLAYCKENWFTIDLSFN